MSFDKIPIKISLVIPTINRVNEVHILLESILDSTYDNLEVIIVDQNIEPILNNLLQNYKKKLPILHLRVDFKGPAKARNYGADHARGDVVSFPDDDSFYSQNALEQIVSEFRKNRDLDCLAIKVEEPGKNTAAILPFPGVSLSVNCRNFFYTTIESNMFWRRSSLMALGGFDPKLGVGTYFASEEGADLIIRALSRKYKMIYTPEIVICHPSVKDAPLVKTYQYARGFGLLMVKHKDSSCLRIYKRKYIGHALIGVLIYLLFKPKKSARYFLRIAGSLTGIIRAREIHKRKSP